MSFRSLIERLDVDIAQMDLPWTNPQNPDADPQQFLEAFEQEYGIRPYGAYFQREGTGPLHGSTMGGWRIVVENVSLEAFRLRNPVYGYPWKVYLTVLNPFRKKLYFSFDTFLNEKEFEYLQRQHRVVLK